ncbi:MAG: P-II family nitrogen regulator [Nitrospira sp.]|nr:P-II family nitrogen regulator [bacterium]MBL7049042.1 P-II family nitrogen regulator [Nitrospira sp.]
MHKLIVTILRKEKLECVVSSLRKENINFTYYDVKGFFKEVHLFHKDIMDRVKVEIVVPLDEVAKVKEIILGNACCGMEGDAYLTVYVVDELVSL